MGSNPHFPAWGLDSFGRSAVHLLVRSEAMSTVLLKDPLDTMTSELLDLLDMAWGCGAVGKL